LRPAKLIDAPEAFVLAQALDPSVEPSTPLENALAVEERVLILLEEVFGSGQAGMAIRLLLGACPDSRSLPLKSRRKLAAEELDMQVATFLKNYEADLLEDVLIEILRRCNANAPSHAESGILS
jgi:hypothetical protein